MNRMSPKISKLNNGNLKPIKTFSKKFKSMKNLKNSYWINFK